MTDRAKQRRARAVAREVVASWIGGIIDGGEVYHHELVWRLPPDEQSHVVDAMWEIAIRLRAGRKP